VVLYGHHRASRPLPLVRSLGYFLPIVEEPRLNPPDLGYLTYLRTRVTTPGPKTEYYTVGVVESVKLRGLVEGDARLGAYYCSLGRLVHNGGTKAVAAPQP
jgi:hypothetical protein